MAQGFLAEKLRVLRARKGLTLAEAAGRAGITPDTLSELERGKRHAYTPTLHKIADGYGIPVEDLLEEPVVPKPPAPSPPDPPLEATSAEERRSLTDARWLQDDAQRVELKAKRFDEYGRRLGKFYAGWMAKIDGGMNRLDAWTIRLASQRLMDSVVNSGLVDEVSEIVGFIEGGEEVPKDLRMSTEYLNNTINGLLDIGHRALRVAKGPTEDALEAELELLNEDEKHASSSHVV
jgi:transcriptional regulator with XRE-family HTH domain